MKSVYFSKIGISQFPSGNISRKTKDTYQISMRSMGNSTVGTVGLQVCAGVIRVVARLGTIEPLDIEHL